MLEVIRYSDSRRAQWDAFVPRAKNGHFFFHRDYLSYHADRYVDHSLLFLKESKLVALLPANLKENALVSHGGLTFGGVVADSAMTVPLMLELFDTLLSYLRENAIAKLVYKCVPYIYHSLPAEEDRYALHVHEARVWRRDVTSTVELAAGLPFQTRRLRGIKKAQAAGVEVAASDDYAAFWTLLEANLLRAHQRRPVHALAEIRSLQERFPEHIRLFGAFRNGTMLGGTVIYDTPNVAHAQYIAASEAGKDVGVLDLLFGWLIGEQYRSKKYFDLGISTENDGRVLNTGLIEQKEGFGACGGPRFLRTQCGRRTGEAGMPLSSCRLIDLPRITDPRGNLTFVEGGRHVPFEIRRVYYLLDVPGGAERGGHCHKELEQVLIAISGSFDVILDDGQTPALPSEPVLLRPLHCPHGLARTG